MNDETTLTSKFIDAMFSTVSEPRIGGFADEELTDVNMPVE